MFALQQQDEESYDESEAVLNSLIHTQIQALIDTIEKIMRRYSLDAENAFNFHVLKTALKKRWGDNCMRGFHLIAISDQLTKEYFLTLGDELGINAEDMTKLFPALAMKLTTSELKCVLSAFKGGFFSKPQDIDAALGEIDNKYTQRFGV